jgi:hypothetical protein
LGANVCISNVVITGHNSKLSSVGTLALSNAGVAENLAVFGHNNRVENLKVQVLAINGHNNSFLGIACVQSMISDSGMNNKFQNCQQLSTGSSHNSSSQSRQQYQNSTPG